MDSSQIVGDDTLYFHFPTLFYSDLGDNGICKEATHWISNPCIINENGNLIVFNILGDTLTLDFKGIPGDSSFVGHSNFLNANMWLTLDSISIENIFGFEDSVKSYTMHSDFFDLAVLQPYIIKLSKSYGFITFFNIYNIPSNETVNYSLVGIDSPMMGLQNVSSVRAFSEMDIGDEFHFTSYSNCSEKKYTKKIIDKVWAVDSSSVEYTIEGCEFYHCNEGPIYSYYSSITHVVDNFTGRDWILSLPDSLILENGDSTRSTFYSNYIPDRSAKGLSYCYWEGGSEIILIEGCFFWLSNFGYGDPGSDYQNQYLKYYHKGDYYWGTPYDCEYLYSLSSKEIENNTFKLNPNPAYDQVNVTFDFFEDGMVIEIRDFTLNMVIEKEISGTESIIDLTNCNSGIYVVVIKDKKGQIVNRGRLIVAK